MGAKIKGVLTYRLMEDFGCIHTLDSCGEGESQEGDEVERREDDCGW